MLSAVDYKFINEETEETISVKAYNINHAKDMLRMILYSRENKTHSEDYLKQSLKSWKLDKIE
jgi:hypothetical protein